MQRWVIWVLAGALIAALPVWRFNSQWTYGPAIAVGFLLLVNLLVLLGEKIGRRSDEL